MDLQFFLDTVPQRIRRRWVAVVIQQNKIPYKTEKALKAYAEHDALHYLFQQPFTEEGEKCVSYLEKKFHRGWLPLGEEYNTFSPVACNCDGITVEMIDEIAEIIYEFYDDYDHYS